MTTIAVLALLLCYILAPTSLFVWGFGTLTLVALFMESRKIVSTWGAVSYTHLTLPTILLV